MIYKSLSELSYKISGDIHADTASRLIYSTDASVYREKPLGVAYPKNSEDVREIVCFCYENNIPIIPRGAGTSLSGQVVGNGLVIDFSRYMTQILELNVEEKWIRVQPGVILDELNRFLKPYHLFFGPEASTSSRCCIGGMVGNNSCGSHSIIYKTTRDHLIEARVVLSDGSSSVFKSLTHSEFENKCKTDSLEGNVYKTLNTILSDPDNIKSIQKEYPDPEIYRRNTGYALDVLAQHFPPDNHFNLCQLLAGSEGTLAITTEIKLNLVSLPPAYTSLICVHFNSLEEVFNANLIALKHNPFAVELMDDNIIHAAKRNPEQLQNTFFIKDDPKAILIIELAKENESDLHESCNQIIHDLQQNNMGYYFPVITGNDVNRVWALRKSGLGVLSNIPGDGKPVTVIEDTAVHVNVLSDYIREFREILKANHMKCVFHAHIGSGEIHLRPILNLKVSADKKKFRQIGIDIAYLVKKYRGSLSGEHGDGRLRSEFIQIMLGKHVINLLQDIKRAFDPKNILNPGKIVYPVKMDESLRYETDRKEPQIDTVFDFSTYGGILRSVEKCNGSADCRKLHTSGGTMCPSFMGTLNEKHTTRARANLLREFLTHSNKKNRFAHKELFEVLDTCLSCKACKTECPSNVDIAKFKSEFLQHYHDRYGISIRTCLFAHIVSVSRLMSVFPSVANAITQSKWIALPVKRLINIASQRNLPKVGKKTLRKHIESCQENQETANKIVYLFMDEFTNYNDTHIGIVALRVLQKLGYRVLTVKHPQSGRSLISKGFMRRAAKIAEKQVSIFEKRITNDSPLIGIEPSTILSFRDEYPDLLRGEMQKKANDLAKNCFLIDEFLVSEYKKGNISRDQFSNEKHTIKLHTHCQQKAIATSKPTIEMLSIPVNYQVTEIKSGCCGMAGSFGYEKEHYELSMKIGEMILFPEIRKTDDSVIIAATGTSCREQIADGTGRKAIHPIEALYLAIKE